MCEKFNLKEHWCRQPCHLHQQPNSKTNVQGRASVSVGFWGYRQLSPFWGGVGWGGVGWGLARGLYRPPPPIESPPAPVPQAPLLPQTVREDSHPEVGHKEQGFEGGDIGAGGEAKWRELREGGREAVG